MLTKSCQARRKKHTPVETPTKPPATRARQMHLVPAYVRNLEPHLRMHVAMPAQHAQPLPKPGRNSPRPAQPAGKARKLFAHKRPSSVVIFCDKDAAPWTGSLFDKAIKGRQSYNACSEQSLLCLFQTSLHIPGALWRLSRLCSVSIGKNDHRRALFAHKCRVTRRRTFKKEAHARPPDRHTARSQYCQTPGCQIGKSLGRQAANISTPLCRPAMMAHSRQTTRKTARILE